MRRSSNSGHFGTATRAIADHYKTLEQAAMNDDRTKERLLALLLIVLMLSGCDPLPNDTKPANVAKLAKHLAYFKDEHGVCYAMLSTASYGSYNVASITAVPCEKVGL